MSEIADPIPEANAFTEPDGPYTDFRMQTSYIRCGGILPCPVAGPPDSELEIIAVCAPYERKVISWTAEREGAPPTVPAPESLDANNVLLDHSISPAVPVPLANGLASAYRISGTYTYAVKAQRNLTNLRAGAMPVVTTPPHTFPAGNFDQALT